jgi:protein-arginine kinase activator protein McsA
MEKAVKRLDFEKAAEFRDRIFELEEQEMLMGEAD